MLLLSLLLLLAQSQEQRDAEKAAEKAAAAAVADFERDTKGAPDAKKIAAIETLAQTQHLKTASRLGAVVGSHDSGAVRQAALKALGSFSDAKKHAGAVLSSALPASAGDPGLFNHVCAAIGDLQDPGSANTLSKFFEDKDENAARVSIEAAGKAGQACSIDPLIAVAGRCERAIKAAQNAAGGVVTDPTGRGFVGTPEVRARDRGIVILKATNEALTAITKQQISTSDAWAAWWSRNRESFGRK